MKNILLLITLISFASSLNAQNKTPETVFVEGGTFKMGSDESKYFDEFPDHDVTLNDFYIGKYEVTIEEYTGFCHTAGLTMPEGDLNMPATNVSWEEAVMYCNWISRLNRLDKCYKIRRDEKTKAVSITFDKNANGYRLPTEAEWEYAARGGNLSKDFAFSGSNNANEVAWYMGTGKTLNIKGKKKSNELGIFDMTGNCQEWCYDVYKDNYYTKSQQNNPINEEGGIERVIRGGNYDGHEETLRLSKRVYNLPNFRSLTQGFRIAKNK